MLFLSGGRFDRVRAGDARRAEDGEATVEKRRHLLVANRPGRAAEDDADQAMTVACGRGGEVEPGGAR